MPRDWDTTRHPRPSPWDGPPAGTIILSALVVVTVLYWLATRTGDGPTVDLQALQDEVDLLDCADDLRDAAAILWAADLERCEFYAGRANGYDDLTIDPGAVCGGD